MAANASEKPSVEETPVLAVTRAVKKAHTNTRVSQTSRLGHWLPSDQRHLNDWLKTTIETAERKRATFHPVIQKFQVMIESDPVMYIYFTQMFQQQSKFPPPPGSGDVKLRNYQQMLVVINHLLTTAPEFDNTKMVGCPLNAILDFPMITPGWSSCLPIAEGKRDVARGAKGMGSLPQLQKLTLCAQHDQ